DEDISQFIQDGYLRVDNAFSAEIAAEARQILWKDLPVNESEPENWTEPVVRLGMYTQKPFVDSVNSPALYSIFDQLIGPNKWRPCGSVGTFPIRFPSAKQPSDIGLHVDASFPGTDSSNYMHWRINIKSKGRALLMLVLFSDVSKEDAPTVLYKGSHIDVARILRSEGEDGLSFIELAEKL